MKFLALLVALLAEQARPLRRDNLVHEGYAAFARTVRDYCDAGAWRHGAAAWVLAVVPLIVVVLAVEWLLAHASSALALVWEVAVLYVSVGFRQFSNYYNHIHTLLKEGDIAGARAQLTRWRAEDASEMTPGEVARVAIEQGLIASHRNVFGPLAWFVVLGPAGALLYRAAEALEEQWAMRRAPDPGESQDFAAFAQRAFMVIDWLPIRLTAASFAVAGNFQDAADCWRTQARGWANANEGVMLASGAGALGVKLGGELHEGKHESGRVRYRPELGTGDDADVDYLSSAVGLIWRALVMWMFLIGVVTLAHILG